MSPESVSATPTDLRPLRTAASLLVLPWMVGCGVAFPAGGTYLEVVTEAAGSSCPAGGVALRVGDDRNADAVLDDAEVHAVSIVCSGSKDLPPEVDYEVFEADDRCPLSGGVLVRIEADRNGNGDIEDDEIQSRVLCHGDGGLLPGDVIEVASFAVTGPAGVEKYLQGVKRFDGNLTVHPHAGTVALPLLETVTGTLEVRPSPAGPGAAGAATLSAPKLTSVGESLLFTALQELDSASLPALKSVGGALTVSDVAYLDDLSLPSLETVKWSLRIVSSGLVEVSLPNLVAAQELSIEDNDRLTALDVPALAEASSLVVRNNPRFGDCLALELARVLREDGFAGEVVIEGNGGEGQCPNTQADCASQEVAGTTVLFCEFARTFESGEADCVALGGHLVMPKTEAFETAFMAEKPEWFSGDAWIGLSDREVEGSFVWVDGTALGVDWAHWAPNEPSNSGGDEHCAHLWSDDGWNDRECDDLLRVACQLP